VGDARALLFVEGRSAHADKSDGEGAGAADCGECGGSGMIDLGEKSAAAFMRRMAKQTPMRRNGSGEEIAKAVLFFATAPQFITGQILAVDGGWVVEPVLRQPICQSSCACAATMTSINQHRCKHTRYTDQYGKSRDENASEHRNPGTGSFLHITPRPTWDR